MAMRARSTLKPGQPGALKLVAQYCHVLISV